MRKAEVLSMTTAPALAAIGAYCLDTDAPADARTISMSSNDFSVSSSTGCGAPLNSSVVPAERSEANSLIEL